MWHDGMRIGMVDPGWFFLAGFFKVLWFVFLMGVAIWFFRWLKHSRRMAWQQGNWRNSNWDSKGWRETKEKFRNSWKTFTNDDALTTARVRLAQGDLTPEQFQDLKTQLEITNEPDPALKIARQRLAKGEISVEEFSMIHDALRA
jgi:uncharacterized membrane protein